MTKPLGVLPDHSHESLLGVLARADAARLKAFAEPLIADLADLGEIEVIENRTGLVMLPMRDTAQGTNFHLGEVLVSEARIACGAVDGYGMRRGRDLEAAMAMAIVDLCVASGLRTDTCNAFVTSEAAAQFREDRDTLRRVEATRVEMETF